MSHFSVLKFFPIQGGPVRHSAAAHAAATAPGLRPLVRPDETDFEGHPQHAIRVLHEPDGRLLHHQPASAAPLLRVRRQLPQRGGAALHLPVHSAAARGQPAQPVSAAGAQNRALRGQRRARPARQGGAGLPAHRNQIPLRLHSQRPLQCLSSKLYIKSTIH
jgi:hypothetical protein